MVSPVLGSSLAPKRRKFSVRLTAPSGHCEYFSSSERRSCPQSYEGLCPALFNCRNDCGAACPPLLPCATACCFITRELKYLSGVTHAGCP
jgi:hypothetical protein